MSSKITVAYGDGIGPEIMTACLSILEKAGAKLEYDKIEIGEKVYLGGHTSGLKSEDWGKLVDNKVFFKAPITTPQGKGYKSLNVTIRKTLGLFANIRPVKSLYPIVDTKHPNIDLTIVRENEEDLYAGIEHRQTPEVFQCLKLVSQPGSEKIIRYAFEYAKSKGKKSVTCMSKDNIMKLTDGIFHKTFDEVAKEYPGIKTNHMIIDIGSARLADTPEDFEVIVTSNLYGDIISDIAAQIAGSVGLAGSANIGQECAMFEAIHGSAPDIAGKNMANPSGLLLAGIEMLNYLGQSEVAETVHNAWLKTMEDGIHTGDVYSEKNSTKKASTTEFTEAVIANLGKASEQFGKVSYPKQSKAIKVELSTPKKVSKKLEGVDVFICEDNRKADDLGQRLNDAAKAHKLNLSMITNRGVKVYPNGNPLTFCTDHWRCRFKSEGANLENSEVIALQKMICDFGLEIIKTENLYTFDGEKGYSLGQGQ